MQRTEKGTWVPFQDAFYIPVSQYLSSFPNYSTYIKNVRASWSGYKRSCRLTRYVIEQGGELRKQLIYPVISQMEKLNPREVKSLA